MSERGWAVSTVIDNFTEQHTRFGESRGKVAYDVLLDLRDSHRSLSFKHIRVRSLGVIDTPDEIADRQAAAFNAQYPIGTLVRVYPWTRDDEGRAYNTTIAKPGAFVMCRGSGSPQVSIKVPGDSITITHVVPLTAAASIPVGR